MIKKITITVELFNYTRRMVYKMIAKESDHHKPILLYRPNRYRPVIVQNGIMWCSIRGLDDHPLYLCIGITDTTDDFTYISMCGGSSWDILWDELISFNYNNADCCLQKGSSK